MTRSAPWKSWLTIPLLLGAVWLALAGLFAAQVAVTTDQTWEDAVVRAMYFWVPWLPCLPATWGFSRLLLAKNVRPFPSVVLHLLMCAAIVISCQAMTPERPPQGGELQQRERAREPRDPGGPLAPPPGEPGQRPPAGQSPGPPWMRDRDRDREGGRRPGVPPGGRSRGFFGPLGFRSLIDGVVYGGVVSLTYAMAFLRRSQQRERRTLELEASLSKARLEALRLQINPHFLFNTLNAIASLIHSRPDDADEMIGSLSELLRASLHGSDSTEISLVREMETLRLFTGIERIRFGERVQFVEDLAPETLGARVPSLIIQPLVENAIRHGLEPQTGPGTVTVQARREGDRLVLRVTDNGAGYDPDKPARPDSGIGIANTRARLQTLYGAEQQLIIAPGAEGGTVVTISIPWHSA